MSHKRVRSYLSLVASLSLLLLLFLYSSLFCSPFDFLSSVSIPSFSSLSSFGGERETLEKVANKIPKKTPMKADTIATATPHGVLQVVTSRQLSFLIEGEGEGRGREEGDGEIGREKIFGGGGGKRSKATAKDAAIPMRRCEVMWQ